MIQTRREKIRQEAMVVEFLRRRLESRHYKKTASAKDYASTQALYEKAKVNLKMLKRRY
jgi:hypothetical protein